MIPRVTMTSGGTSDLVRLNLTKLSWTDQGDLDEILDWLKTHPFISEITTEVMFKDATEAIRCTVASEAAGAVFQRIHVMVKVE